ncbi:E3 ubiquitin-protein ligase RNF167-like [Ricinus communis]|uniref:E3 ubiquitin-protein ligase RNF167-like n=1 Tax=Ricinus communis TaxID=3988 RepID=UPI00201A425A|nr:E3 ubiquitin-protein ligase RNF167-like [Ricinus communis]
MTNAAPLIMDEVQIAMWQAQILQRISNGNIDSDELQQPDIHEARNHGLKSVVVVDGDGEICGICLEEMEQGDETKAMDCMHRFHPSCIAQWLKREKNTCPLCRHQMRIH